MSLEASAETWAEATLAIPAYDRASRAAAAAESIRQHGYDIHYEAKKLEEIYQS